MIFCKIKCVMIIWLNQATGDMAPSILIFFSIDFGFVSAWDKTRVSMGRFQMMHKELHEERQISFRCMRDLYFVW